MKMDNDIKTVLEFISKELQTIKSQLEENTAITKVIHDRQERQDKILESLALRFLEQETELRDLKRIK